MHSSSLDTEYVKHGGEVLVTIATLVIEGRIPGKLDSKTKKGFYEGPHCTLNNKHSRLHKCNLADNLCLKYDNVRDKVLNLWKKNIPLCIEVLLTCSCKEDFTGSSSSSSTSLPSDKNKDDNNKDSLLLEKWYFNINHRRITESPIFNFTQLITAIRSQLYFSQLSAWLSVQQLETTTSSINNTNNKITSKNLRYRLTIPGETYESMQFVDIVGGQTSTIVKHDFPLTDIGNGFTVSVQFLSLPRMSSIPIIGNNNNNINCSKCLFNNNNNNKQQQLLENVVDVVDDRMYTNCTMKGKHRCEDFDDFDNTNNTSSTSSNSNASNSSSTSSSSKNNLTNYNNNNYKRLCQNNYSEPSTSRTINNNAKSTITSSTSSNTSSNLLWKKQNNNIIVNHSTVVENKGKLLLDAIERSGLRNRKCTKRGSMMEDDDDDDDDVCGGQKRKENDFCCCDKNESIIINNKSGDNNKNILFNIKGKCNKFIINNNNNIYNNNKSDNDNNCDNHNIPKMMMMQQQQQRPRLKQPIVDRLKLTTTTTTTTKCCHHNNTATTTSNTRRSPRKKITFDDDDDDDIICDNNNMNNNNNKSKLLTTTITTSDNNKFDTILLKDNNNLIIDIPSALDQAKFRKDLDNAASMVFHSRTGLPLTSSPAPVRRKGVNNKSCFDFDSSLNSVYAIKSALFSTSFSTDDDSESDGGSILSSPCSPEINAVQKTDDEPPSPSIKYRRKGHAANLLGSFEESVLNGRLEPISTVQGFTAELGASGSFVPKHLVVPVTVFFYTLGDNDKISSPYLGHINLGKKGFNVPKSGTVQVTLFNPLGTVVKMFVIMYDLSDMPANSQTFIRQRTLYMPTNCKDEDVEWGPKWLRYLVHLRFLSSKSGKIYLHSDIRMIIFRKSDLDTATAHGIDMLSYELRSFTHMPTNPRFSPRK